MTSRGWWRRTACASTSVTFTYATGSSTGAHLHFEIRDREDRPLNPSLFLDRKFATSDELPLSAALRAPRGTRVAFVSHIPASKRGLMQAKSDEKTEAATATNAPSGNLDDLAIAVDKVAGRPHARISMVFSPKETEAPRSDPAA